MNVKNYQQSYGICVMGWTDDLLDDLALRGRRTELPWLARIHVRSAGRCLAVGRVDHPS